MPNITKDKDDTVLNINFQLLGEEAVLLSAYQEKEFLRTISSAARKGLLEYLHSLKNRGKLVVAAEETDSVAA